MLVEQQRTSSNNIITSAKEYYFNKENKRILRVYGHNIFSYSKQLDLNSFFPKPLSNHEIDSKFRTKLIDWLFEVFNAMNCVENTIYLTLHLFDNFLYKYKEKKLINDHVHLIGVSCLFIASKYEDMTPLFMHDLKTKICHNRFSEKELKEMEKLILKVLNFSLIINSMGDFIRSYCYEFRVSNKSNMRSKEQELNFDDIELFAVYISKVILHSDTFSSYKNSIKSIASIVIAFEIVRTQKKMSDPEEELLKKWILTLMENSGFDPDDINSLYNQIADYYSSFQSINISHNLLKSSNLPY